jgi:hypothetical protein
MYLRRNRKSRIVIYLVMNDELVLLNVLKTFVYSMKIVGDISLSLINNYNKLNVEKKSMEWR